jgi:hypothetical protein
MAAQRIGRRRLLVVAMPLAAVILAVAPVALGRWESTGGVSPMIAPAPTLVSAMSPVEPVPPAQREQAPAPLPTARTVTLTPLSHLSLGDTGFHGDVWGHNGFAYVGSWGSYAACPATGVKIVDVRDPLQPRWVSTVANIAGTSQEDVVVRAVKTADFSGDLLVVGIQICNGGPGIGGMSVWDVTDPYNPVGLSFFPTSSRGVHELDLIQHGERVLALLAVPNSEAQGGGGDFRIVDLSNPRQPVQLSAWGARSGLGLDLGGGIGCTHQIYDHSARASADGMRAYLSYWDAGVVMLDISDPSAPRVLGRLVYPAGEEGSTHSVAPTADGHLLLVADEDDVFRTPLGLHLRVQTADGPRDIRGCESQFAPRLDTTGVIDSRVIDGSSACSGMALPESVRGNVAVIAEGTCSLTQQAARLAAAGARAIIVGTDGDVTSMRGPDAGVPVVAVSAADAAVLRRAAGGEGAPITLPFERHWSGLRIVDITDPAAPQQIGGYQTPNSLAFPAPSDGYYTIHNAEVRGDLAVLSWYSDGVRVLDIADPTQPREMAAYVPPAAANPLHNTFPDETLVWGVAVMGDLVLVSDINSGLHVLRLAQ